MAKIRGIKPEYWTDEDIVELSIPARLLFIGLWNFACDNGHVDDKPKQIKMRIFPADDIDVGPLLDELSARRRIERSGGYLTIARFAEHQKPHKRWWATCDNPLCELPEGAGPQGLNRGTRSTTTLANSGATVAQPLSTSGATADGDGDGDGDVDGEGDGEVKKRARKRARQLPTDWTPTESHVAKAAERRLDLNHEVDQFRSYHEARATTFVDWDKAFHNWLGKSFRTAAPLRRQPDDEVNELRYWSPPEPPDDFAGDLGQWYREQSALELERRRRRA